MPRKPFQRSIEAQALRELEEELQAAIEQVAAEHGPSMDADPVSDEQATRLWGIRDPGVDGDDLLTTLLTGGLDQETLANLKVVKENPELAPFYGPQANGQPLPYEVAKDLAVLAEFPWRFGIFKDFLESDPKEAVEIAERIDRAYQKKVGAMPETGATGMGLEPMHDQPGSASVPAEAPAAPPTGYQTPLPADLLAQMGG